MWKGLRFFLRHGWRYDKLYVVYKVLYQLTSAFVPVVLTVMPKYIIDELLGARRMDVLLKQVAVMAGYALFANAASAFFNTDSFTRRCRVDAAFGLDLHRNLARADYENLESPGFLDMRKKAEKFLYCDWHGFGYLLDCALDIAGQTITLVSLAAVVGALNIWILLLFASLVVMGAMAEAWARKRAMRLSLEVVATQRNWRYYSNRFPDFRYGKEIRLNGIGEWLVGREKIYCERYVDNMRRQNGYYIRSGLLGALSTFLQQGAAYVYLIRRVLVGGVGIGDFTMYVGAVTAFAAAFRRVLDSAIEIQSYDSYYESLDQYLRVPAKLLTGRAPLPAGPHRIEFREVGFRYAGQEAFALRHVNLVLEPGDKLSVAGENGAGKTTFIKLLLRLYDPSEGVILLDGADIRTLDCTAYRALFGTVLQDFKLFSFSLKENVCFGAEAADAQIEDILRQVGLGDKLEQLPRGIHTALNREFDEQGFEPSGGEGQKIAIARALYRQAPILVLDEPTAALDPRAEYELYQRFHALVGARTAVFVSHRLSSARFCDKIAVFARGRLAEYGACEELLAAGGLFAGLYGMQAQFYQ